MLKNILHNYYCNLYCWHWEESIDSYFLWRLILLIYMSNQTISPCQFIFYQSSFCVTRMQLKKNASVWSSFMMALSWAERLIRLHDGASMSFRQTKPIPASDWDACHGAKISDILFWNFPRTTTQHPLSSIQWLSCDNVCCSMWL